MHWRLVLVLFVVLSPLGGSKENDTEDGILSNVIDAVQRYGGNLQSLLHWAIENSDPQKLREQAESAAASIKHQAERMAEFTELMSQTVSESDVMKEAIQVLMGSSSAESAILKALETLESLVERIDNANDLQMLGGIQALLNQLGASDRLAAMAAGVLGVAASNNPTFQSHLLSADPEILSKLIQLMKSGDGSVVSNALYAVSSIIRNSEELQTLFYSNGGLGALHRILGGTDNLRQKRKCLTLLADLLQTGNLQITDTEMVELVVTLARAADWDLVEKALMTLSYLMNQPATFQILKSLPLDEILTQQWSAAGQEAASGDRSEYFRELQSTLDDLLQRFKEPVPDHSEL